MSYADFLIYLSLNLNADVATGERSDVSDRLAAASKLVGERTSISPSGRPPEGRQDGEGDDLRPGEDNEDDDWSEGDDLRPGENNEDDDWRARERDLPPQSGFPYFDEDDAQAYRGIATKTGLDRAVAPEDDWPDVATRRPAPKASSRRQASPKKRS
jgi:hypothetical protein